MATRAQLLDQCYYVALVSLLVVFHGCNLACSADWLFWNKVKALMKAKSMMEGWFR